jgi:hypothetical protein
VTLSALYIGGVTEKYLGFLNGLYQIPHSGALGGKPEVKGYAPLGIFCDSASEGGIDIGKTALAVWG